MSHTETPEAVPQLIPQPKGKQAAPGEMPTPTSSAPSKPTDPVEGAEKKTHHSAFLTSTRTHKRRKSWDASTPVLKPPQEQEPYPRPRSRSPLRHGIIEVEEEEEEQEEEANKRRSSAGDDDRSYRRATHELIAPTASEWLGSVIGINPEDWPYSQELLASTVSLKLEQAKSKNLSMKLSTVNASMDLLRLAVESNIPPQLIPYMVASGELSRQDTDAALKEMGKAPRSPQKGQQTATSVFKVNIPQPTQFQFHHWQKPGDPKGDFKDERKRKSSTEDQPLTQPQPHPYPHSTVNTPARTSHSTPQASHRRNQSEANVSHLRSLYESQTHPTQHAQHRPQRLQPVRQLPPSYPQQYYQQQQQQPLPQWAGPSSLGSPYLPSRESQQGQFPGRPVYYQYPPPPQSSLQRPPPKAPAGYPLPLPGFQFPRREMPPPVQTQGQAPPQTQPRSLSATSSPASAKKGDVSFLISTPNNPPK